MCNPGPELISNCIVYADVFEPIRRESFVCTQKSFKKIVIDDLKELKPHATG